MARHRRPPSRRAVRPAAARRAALPAVTVAVAGAVTVGAAFAVGGPADSASIRPAARAGGFSTAAAAGTDAATSTDAAVSAGTVAPSAADAAGIAEAVHTSDLTADVPPENYEVTGTKLARSDTSWAWTQLRPKVPDLDRVQGVLHRTGDRWELVQIGSWEVGCDVVPAQPSRDLGLICAVWTGPTVNA